MCGTGQGRCGRQHSPTRGTVQFRAASAGWSTHEQLAQVAGCCGDTACAVKPRQGCLYLASRRDCCVVWLNRHAPAHSSHCCYRCCCRSVITKAATVVAAGWWSCVLGILAYSGVAAPRGCCKGRRRPCTVTLSRWGLLWARADRFMASSGVVLQAQSVPIGSRLLLHVMLSCAFQNPHHQVLFVIICH